MNLFAGIGFLEYRLLDSIVSLLLIYLFIQFCQFLTIALHANIFILCSFYVFNFNSSLFCVTFYMYFILYFQCHFLYHFLHLFFRRILRRYPLYLFSCFQYHIYYYVIVLGFPIFSPLAILQNKDTTWSCASFCYVIIL